MTKLACISLIDNYDEKSAIIVCDGKKISQQQFLKQLAIVRSQLPACPYTVNLCQDRYHFLLTFAATIANGGCNILPPNQQPLSLQDIAEQYKSPLFVCDSEIPNLPAPSINIVDTFKAELPLNGDTMPPMIPGDQLAVIAYTSGSTGEPSANLKHWKTLSGTAKRLGDRLTPLSKKQRQAQGCNQFHIVATVPSQHMYGLEMTTLMALQASCVIQSAHPFYPYDVAQILEQTPTPRILVTTPFHLRTIIESDTQLPKVDKIISATAPLSLDIAEQVEKQYKTRVEEIYGCTEAGSIATRRTTEENWHWLDEVHIENTSFPYIINAPHLTKKVPLQDQLEPLSATHFKLQGRSGDTLNVAGKRASLQDLNQKLLAINGVIDGVIFKRESKNNKRQRLAAFVVAPSLSAQDIHQVLLKRIDPAFLPRSITLVASLPRNSTGKLSVNDLKQMHENARQPG